MAIPSLMNPGMSSGDIFRQNMRQRLGFGSSPMPSQAPVGIGNPIPANPNTGIVPPSRSNSSTGATNPSGNNNNMGETPRPMPVPNMNNPNSGGGIMGGWSLNNALPSSGIPRNTIPFIPTKFGGFDYGATQNTNLYGKMNNPYGPTGLEVFHSPASGGPPVGMYTPNQNILSKWSLGAMPDIFTNMNYNLPVYGNVAPYPGMY